MRKKIKSMAFVVCAVMIFTAQTKAPDDKGQQHAARPAGNRPTTARPAPAARPAPVARPAPAARPASAVRNQARPQAQPRTTAPAQNFDRVPSGIPVPLDERREATPRVYAVAASAPVQNNRLLNRQHHNHWQPRYNFYDNQYHFYPYVNIASLVELTSSGVSVGFDGQNYYYDQGTFYIPDQSGQYEAVAPPVGIIVPALPANARQISVDGQIYDRYKGVFYSQVSQGYQVIGPVQPVPADQ